MAKYINTSEYTDTHKDKHRNTSKLITSEIITKEALSDICKDNKDVTICIDNSYLSQTKRYYLRKDAKDIVVKMIDDGYNEHDIKQEVKKYIYKTYFKDI